MRRSFRLALLAGLVAAVCLPGCSKEPRRPVSPTPDEAVEPKEKQADPARPGFASDRDPARPAAPRPLLPEASPEQSAQDRHDAALLDALGRMAEKDYIKALAALETARTAQDTEQVRREIERLKAHLAQQTAAERALDDLQIVLTEGKADEAARLASAALRQYGGTDAGERLAKLKRQADALLAAELNDNTARRDRFRGEAETALRERDLRAAVLAFEQALQYGDDAALRRQLEAVRADLTRYDDNRRRAAELRRDAASLEDALAALEEAAKAWETPQVRQEIDECRFALQKRRDRLSVADFEVRGDLGLPAAGRTIADELLPAFRGRFDLVERGQLGKVIAELKLDASGLAENDHGRRELGRLARLRYLVVGSITPLSGLTIHARLVDVHTGLVVQTARLSAPSAEELMALLPQLATLLQMTDEQKLAYEQRLPRPIEVRPMAPAPLPPPPAAPVAGVALPPPVVIVAPPPGPGRLRFEDFERLPPPPPPGQPLPPPVIVLEREAPVKQRLLQVAIELGDNNFRRGRYQEAFVHFELAFGLSSDRHDLRVRLDNCRPYLPPPPPVVVPLPPPRPRIAVLDFLEAGPGALPPGMGAWTAEHLAPYFCPPYQAVDRAEVFWYMGRLGMSLADLVHDPAARRWLGRALDVRFFVLGTVRPAAGIEVTTHLVDAEHGFLAGTGRVVAFDRRELKLRLAELARQTLLDPRERERFCREVESSRSLVIQANKHFDRGEFALSLQLSEKAHRLRPDNIEIAFFFQKSRDRTRQAELEEARRREHERQLALAAEYERRQRELAREAEAARLRAEREAAARIDTERLAHTRHREKAHTELLVQGRVALDQGNFGLSIQFFESAVSLKRTDEGIRDLARARARAEEKSRTRAAEEQARREAGLRQKREAELVQARAQLEEERRRRDAEEKTQREAFEARDRAEYTRLLDQAQRLLAQEKYDPAVEALQTARRLRKSDEVERLLSQALVEQARATAQKKDAQTRAELERKLEEERKRREQAEAEARRNQERYTQALELAQRAQAEKKYDQAAVQYQEAAKIYRTDVVLTGLRQVEEARAREKAEAEAARKKHLEEQKQAQEVQRLLGDGWAALKAGKLDAAFKAFTDAKKLAPSNVDVLAGLAEAEQAREEAAARTRRQQEDARVQAEAKKRAGEFDQWMRQGRTALAAKQYDPAIQAFREAQKINPKDQASAALLKDAEKAKADAAAAAAAQARQAEEAARKKKEEEQRTEQVRQLVAEGRAHLQAGRLDAAEKSLAEASKLAPKQPAVLQAQQELQQARRSAGVEAEKRKRADYDRAMNSGRAAVKARDHAGAIVAYTEALRLMPGDREAGAALKDAEKARDEQARAAADAAAKKKEEAKRQADYERLMNQGRAALTARRLPEAVQAFGEAVKMKPGDTEATRALGEATQALEASKKPKPEPAAPAAYAKQMEAGAAFEKQQKYNDAIKAYREALRLMPGDAKATQALKSVQFKDHLADGQRALKAKRFAEAVRAFEEALKLSPDDAEAKKLLRQAKERRP